MTSALKIKKGKLGGPKIIRVPNRGVGLSGDGQRVTYRSPPGLSQSNRNILFDQRNEPPTADGSYLVTVYLDQPTGGTVSATIGWTDENGNAQQFPVLGGSAW